MNEQEIRDWCVAGDDSIVGNVYHRPGHADGETIITSPVVQVRLMGQAKIPMAVTESGSAYWLGAPSRRFGLDKAEAFVRRLSTSVRPVDASRAESQKTILPALQDLLAAGENNKRPGSGERQGSGASLAVTCEGCGAVAVTKLADEVSSVNTAGGISIDDPCPACGGRLAARPGQYRLNDATGMLERAGDYRPQAAADQPAHHPRPRLVKS